MPQRWRRKIIEALDQASDNDIINILDSTAE